MEFICQLMGKSVDDVAREDCDVGVDIIGLFYDGRKPFLFEERPDMNIGELDYAETFKFCWKFWDADFNGTYFGYAYGLEGAPDASGESKQDKAGRPHGRREGHMPGRPHPAGQPEDEARTVLEQGEEEQDDQRGIESLSHEKDRDRQFRPEERAAESLIKDILLTDSKEDGGKPCPDGGACLQRQDKAEAEIDSDED
jgi:hypothetical protein